MEFTHVTFANTYFGKGCVKKYAEKWLLGARAYVVTGRHSGRSSGALQDVLDMLSENGIESRVFEGVENNPTVEQCRELGKEARDMHADFIVAIGGGSPLDAAKAVAVFAVEEITTEALYQNAYDRVLPIVAIPTTSGTGSEVTPWSILTRLDLQTKKSFGSLKTLPAVALMDADYTRSLPQRITLHTALDACTHCMESLISIKSTPLTDALNIEALRRFAPCLPALERGDLEPIRGTLMLVSMMGGMAIAHTGTTLMHGMGYPLTYYQNLTHGESNCVVMPAYLNFIGQYIPEKLQRVMDALSTDVETIAQYIKRNFPTSIRLTDEEIAHYAAQTMLQNSTRNMGFEVRQDMIEALYRQSFA